MSQPKKEEWLSIWYYMIGMRRLGTWFWVYIPLPILLHQHMHMHIEDDVFGAIYKGLCEDIPCWMMLVVQRMKMIVIRLNMLWGLWTLTSWELSISGDVYAYTLSLVIAGRNSLLGTRPECPAGDFGIRSIWLPWSTIAGYKRSTAYDKDAIQDDYIAPIL